MSRLSPLARAGICVAAAATGLTGAVTSGFATSVPLASNGLATYRSCIITASPASTTAVSDAYVQQNAGNSNFGTASSLVVQARSGQNHRSYVWFDLSRCSPLIPSTASVTQATLRLFVTTLPSSCRTYDAFRVTTAWSETTVTWNNQPFTGINNPPSAQRTAAITIGPGCENATNNVYVTGWNVTGDVQAFVAETQGLHGWMVRDDVENAGGGGFAATFAAKEAGQSDRAPQLVVTYTP